MTPMTMRLGDSHGVARRFLVTSGRCRCRPMKPLHFAANPLQPISQQLWADAVYVKDMWELGQSQDSDES